jgi:hypothetical protein
VRRIASAHTGAPESDSTRPPRLGSTCPSASAAPPSPRSAAV